MTRESNGSVTADKDGPFFRALSMAFKRPSYALHTITAAAIKRIITGTKGIDHAITLIAKLN